MQLTICQILDFPRAKFFDLYVFRPSHTSLKSRDRGQNAPEDLSGRDFRRELEERERLANISKERERGRGRITDKEKDEVDRPPKRLKVEQNLDADDPLDESDADDSDSDSDDDETAALMAELQKIKREKAVEEKEKVCFVFSFSPYIHLIRISNNSVNLLQD